jgi:peptidoglycan/xylan/chitin deacetylase (PgdA/CDA1 family)
MNAASFLNRDECCIFLLHGVTRSHGYQVRNYTRKHLPEDDFRTFLAELVKHGTPISMDDVTRSLAHGAFPCQYPFAITFDDGFENNLSIAAPILQEFSVPATFYVSTRLIDENRMTWIDSVEDCLEHTTGGAVILPWQHEPRSLSSREDKIAILDDIRGHVKANPSIDENRFAHEFCRSLGRKIVEHSDDPLDKKLDWQQLNNLAECPLFTIGGHSHDHCNLAFLDAPALDFQIRHSLALLHDHLPYRIMHYSYPEGTQNAFSADVEAVLRQHGIACCPTAMPGTTSAVSSPFRLRRMNVV